MKIIFIIVFLPSLLISCAPKEDSLELATEGDLIIIAGQSNAFSGLGYNQNIDVFTNTYQLTRSGQENLTIVQATSPLQHHQMRSGRIGFDMTFSKSYIQNFENKKLIFLPAAKGLSSFAKKNWTTDGDLYQDMMYRIHFIAKNYPNVRLRALLWQQGESDLFNNDYEKHLTEFITTVNSEMEQLGYHDFIILMGGTLPIWNEKSPKHSKIYNTIQKVARKFDNSFFISTYLPTRIKKEIDLNDSIHFDAPGQRILGLRYFKKYLEEIE